MEGASKTRESVTGSWSRMGLLPKKIGRREKREGSSCCKMEKD